MGFKDEGLNPVLEMKAVLFSPVLTLEGLAVAAAGRASTVYPVPPLAIVH
jgi:hypothetical protein